ncbi:hypothetical protein BZL30_3314 [Mycobacterium kansasii]|uniref:Uncharacterized protein n=1 Tax=Mycobacterium kansasii TaxID=1768 RepID=A0A1V3XC02_MYCKA|nr:hypothetical protein BZL30_3314 [Mycobacterium kansasii]
MPNALCSMESPHRPGSTQIAATAMAASQALDVRHALPEGIVN